MKGAYYIMNPFDLFVCALGMIVVFISLFVIVLLCELTHKICDKLDHFFSTKKANNASPNSK